MENQKKKGGNIRFVWHFLQKGAMKLFALAIVGGVLNILFNAAIPQVLSRGIDAVVSGGDVTLPVLGTLRVGTFLAVAALGVILCSVLSGVGSYLSRVYTSRGSETFLKDMRDTIYRHIQHLPFDWHVRHQTGEIIQRCTSDVEVVRNFVTSQLLEVFRIIFLVTFYLVVMFSMNVKITLVALIFIPVVVAYSTIFYSRIAKRFLIADEAEGVLSSVVQENLTGVRVVRAFGRERFEMDKFNEKNNHYSNLWIELGKLMSAFWCFGDLITGLQILTVIAVGTICAVNGEISLGQFTAFIAYNQTMIWPVRSLGRILSEMSKAGVSIERVRYILDAQEETDREGAKDVPLAGDIRFEDVTFAYGDGPKVLDHVSFTIPRGQTFAILGGTGSGKSTITYLLDRLYDLPEGCGRITIGGVDIRDISRESLRRQIGLVLQEPYLFSRTIEQNIGITSAKPDVENVRESARIACVDEAIETFTDGYETVVGERGVTLSGGQKQRVAIARMLTQHAPVMVFDDSLSAVDAETDAKIRAQLKEKTADATVILISHRITTLMQADQILVIDGGHIAQHGTHEDLIARDGIYKQIYDIQLSSADRALLGEEV